MKKKDKVELICIGVIVLMTLWVLLIQDRKAKQEESDWIARPDAGTREQAVLLRTGDAEERITITVGERERAEEEIQQAFERTLIILKETCLLSVNEKMVWKSRFLYPGIFRKRRWESVGKVRTKRY